MTTQSDLLLNRQEAAKYLGVKGQTLAVWASTKRYALPFIRVGAAVRYRRADLDDFLRSRTVTPGAPELAAAAEG